MSYMLWRKTEEEYKAAELSPDLQAWMLRHVETEVTRRRIKRELPAAQCMPQRTETRK